MKKVFVLGSGGHAKVLIDCLHQIKNIQILGLLEINSTFYGVEVLGEKVIGNEDEILSHYSPKDVYLINAIGSVRVSKNRQVVYEKFKKLGYQFLSVIHPTASVASEVRLGEGVQLMAGCTIQPGNQIGVNVIVNTNASVDHDCIIRDHVHIAPGVTCSGSVNIGLSSHIGTGAVIIEGVTIGNYCLIAAGAVVVSNISDGSKVAGIPAKRI